MASIYLSAHGNSGAGETFVPLGKTVTFYCQEGDGVSLTVTAAVVSLKSGVVSFTLPGGAPVNNYTIGPLDSGQAASELRFLSSKLPGDFVQWPDNTFLCDSGECRVETGHTCTGLLGKPTEGYDAIHLLICRGEGDLEYYDLPDMQNIAAKFLQLKTEEDRRSAWNSYDDSQRAQLILLGNVSAWYETLCANLWAEGRGGSPFALARYLAAAEEYVHTNLQKYGDSDSLMGQKMLRPIQGHVEGFLREVTEQNSAHADLVYRIIDFCSGISRHDPTGEWNALPQEGREDFLALLHTRKMTPEAFDKIFKFAGKESFEEWCAAVPPGEWWMDSDVLLVRDRAFVVRKMPGRTRPDWPACLHEQWCWVDYRGEMRLIRLNTDDTPLWRGEV